MSKPTEGYVYILESPNSSHIKIGGSDYPPTKRVKEINSSGPYKGLGPWSLSDFRQVSDWRKVEGSLHYAFRSKLVTEVDGQKELFAISFQEAAQKLESIDSSEILKKPKIDRMFQDQEFSSYILRLFQFTGLNHWLDYQGAWTFVLFPQTSGGRYFTLNIGPHEVAFSTLPKNRELSHHWLVVDKLILDFPEVVQWVITRGGGIQEDVYDRALPRSASVHFKGTFADVITFMKLDGGRRALIAYWTEALVKLAESQSQSTYARYHNWNAVAEIRKRLRNTGEPG